jgi:hypothetical protein
MARVGVLLLNLGGPERIQDVGPCLYNLFADPEIIRLPIPALQKPLAWLISSLRAGKSQAAYRSIGGGSPLRRITEQQARELQSNLRQRGIEATSYVAMRYWHPFTESAVADIKADGIDEVVVLPLTQQRLAALRARAGAPAMMAAGVAKPNAHGHAMTITDTALKMASLTSPIRSPVTRPVAIATPITAGTKTALTWSTKR